ncbi:hypothetical protein [Pseudonocardia sp.]|uniref:hypothetical protein n=1 Tax=Pseudonocardia sp. TaxID=60912 RepID=UPI0031FD268C
MQRGVDGRQCSGHDQRAQTSQERGHYQRDPLPPSCGGANLFLACQWIGVLVPSAFPVWLLRFMARPPQVTFSGKFCGLDERCMGTTVSCKPTIDPNIN